MSNKTIFTAVSVLSFLLSGCVSSLLKEDVPDFSNQLKVKSPGSGYEKINSGAYLAWKHEKNQNVIMISSECEANQPSLSSAYQTFSESLSNVNIISSSNESFKNTKSILKNITGMIDDSPIQLKVLSFKYKSCTYNSALSGKPESISLSESDWNNFNQKIEFKK